MFNFDGVVLRKIKVKYNKSVLHIFSKEFGKISIWLTESKNKTNADIGNTYSFTSKTENGINKADSVKAKNIINTEKLGFKEINNILNINVYLGKVLPNGMLFETIYDDYNESLKYLEDKKQNEKITEFFLLRTIKRLGFAKQPEKENSSINFIKIFSIIDIYNIEGLMKIEGISSENINEMKLHNQSNFNNYLN